MASKETKPVWNFREGALGWWLMQAGWEPVEQTGCERGGEHHKDQSGKCDKCHQFAHPLWRFASSDELLTAWEARRRELRRIHDDFKAKGAAA
jgi:hypothetical protein